MADRYGTDVLSGDWRQPPRGRSVDVNIEPGMVLEDATTGYVGAIVRIDADLGMFILEDRRSRRRSFPFGPGFLLDGKPVVARPPAAAAPRGPRRTASGSLAVENARARVALPSRILVEGKHDAELVEKVWGDDLRVEGVAVELLNGVDDLVAVVDDFDPAPDRRLGVLVDHLVEGSKESRVVAPLRGRPHVLVVGHPYVDVWQAVKPERLGLEAWPTISRDVEWKRGICAHLGWQHGSQADVARAWQRILGTVRSYADLEPSFLGRVEELIDFVTAP